jgi:hypothetical protein
MNIKDKEALLRVAENVYSGFVKQGFKIVDIYEWMNLEGRPIFWRARFENQKSNKKILPFYRNGQGGYSAGEPPEYKGKPKLLYGGHLLSRYPDAAVTVVEGEKCVDALNEFFARQGKEQFHVAVTSGGNSSAESADFTSISKRSVKIWPDNDEHGNKYAERVEQILKFLGCAVTRLDISTFNLPEKGDCFDWLEMNRGTGIEDFEALIVSETQADEKDSSGRSTNADALVALALESVNLILDENREVYAVRHDTKEILSMHGRKFKDYLVAKFYETYGKSIRDPVMRDAMYTLSGLARQSNTTNKVYRRIAKHGNDYYLDLCQSGNSLAVKISSGAYEIVEAPPVYFIRSDTMDSLPIPIDGDLNVLFSVINIPVDADLLIIAWLIESLRIDSPYPILELVGEQGSAKSTTHKVLRRLIDPSTCDLRGSPKNVEDIYVSAGSNHVVSFENVSHLSQQMQDACCTISTHGSFAKRKLYTDGDEHIIWVNNPIIINGIAVSITAQDLWDRAITIELPRVTERMEVSEIWDEFNKNHSKILGGLLTCFAQALEILPNVDLAPNKSPRLIEFAKLGMAIAKCLNRTDGDFMGQFNRYRQEAIARTIDSSPVASAVIEWLEDRSVGYKEEKPIKELFREIPKPESTEAWPKSPKGFGDALRRAAPALRDVGIECRSLGKRGSYIWWRIERTAIA